MEANPRLLRYFVTVADTGNFTRAAELLHVSQPALSQQIRRLESEVGFSLFVRGTRTVSLTGSGRELLDTAREVIESADSFRSRARGLRGGSGGLTIGYRAANDLTRRLLKAFHAQHGSIDVELRQYPMPATHAGLDTGEVDLAILRLPIDLTGLQTLALYQESRVAVLPSTHALAGRRHITLADLAQEPWITTSATDAAWQRHVQPKTRSRQPRRERVVVNTLDEFLEAVSDGRGVALAAASAARFYPRTGISYVDVSDAEPTTVCLGWRTGAPRTNPTIAAFIRTTRAVLKEGR